MKPFDRRTVKVGDLLCLVRDPQWLLRFRGFGHDGVVIARWVDESRIPRDAILLQKQVCMVEATC